MVSSAPGTANTPRAHITNMATLGVFSQMDPAPGKTQKLTHPING